MWLTGQRVETWTRAGFCQPRGGCSPPVRYTVVIDEFSGPQVGASYCHCGLTCGRRDRYRCEGTVDGGGWRNGCGQPGWDRSRCR